MSNKIYAKNTNTLTDDVNSTDNTTSNQTSKTTPTLMLENREIEVGENITFYASLPDDATGKVVFKINNKSLSSAFDVNGGIIGYSYIIPNTYKSSTYNLTVVYGGNNIYNPVTNTSILTLKSYNNTPTVELANYVVKYASNVTFTVNLNSTATGKIVFKVNGLTISPEISLVNGKANYTYTLPTNLYPKRYNLTVVYSGDINFNRTVKNARLNITRINSTATVYDVTSKAGSKTKFNATVIDELGNPIAKSYVVFKLNKAYILGNSSTNSNGYVELTSTLPSNLDLKSYEIQVATTTNDLAEGTKAYGTLNLTQLKTKVTVVNLTAKAGDNVTLSATITDENNNNVLRNNVTFFVNGHNISVVNVSNGFATLRYTVPFKSSTLNVNVYYQGNWKYASSSSNGKITMTKLRTYTAVGGIKAVTGTTANFTANVTDQNQNRVTNGTVRFKIGSTTIADVTVKNGSANYTYNLPLYSAGNYRITAIYLGTSIHQNSTKDNVLEVSRINTTIRGTSYTTTVGSTLTLSVNVTDRSRYNVANGTVRFYVNNKFVSNATVNKGVASIKYVVPYNLESKVVQYNVTYVQNSIYANSSYKNNITIGKRLDVYVSTTGNDNNNGEKNTPYKTIKTAIKHVALLGTVHLSSGTYTENNIIINQSVQIVGTGINKTVINGNNNGKAIFTNEYKNVSLIMKNITVKNGRSLSSYSAGAIVSSGKLILSDMLFTNNSATGNFSTGAIYSIGTLVANRTTFTNNVLTAPTSEGGAIRIVNNDTNLTNCSFTNNKVTGRITSGGGAIYVSDGVLRLIGVKFNNNTATGKNITGGAIKASGGNITMVNCSYTNNVANSTNFALSGAVGGVGTHIYAYTSNFTSNKAIGVSSGGGSAIYTQYAYSVIANSRFINNQAQGNNTYGGALYYYYVYASLGNVTFENNKAISSKGTAYGGAFYNSLGNLTARNLTFKNNVAKGQITYGGAMYYYGTKLVLNKTVFTSNNASGESTGIGGAIFSSSYANITDCDFTTNRAYGSQAGGGAIASLDNINVTKSNFESNYAYDNGNAITNTGSTINVNSNYWGSASPTWSTLFKGVSTPTNYSKTKISH